MNPDKPEMPTQPENPEQSERFEQAAQALDFDESPEAFDLELRRGAPQKPDPKSSR